jgi:hypothetical protein
MDIEKLFSDAEKRNEYDRQNQSMEKWCKNNLSGHGTYDSLLKKAPS